MKRQNQIRIESEHLSQRIYADFKWTLKTRDVSKEDMLLLLNEAIGKCADIQDPEIRTATINQFQQGLDRLKAET